jgi:hypothetical protein
MNQSRRDAPDLGPSHSHSRTTATSLPSVRLQAFDAYKRRHKISPKINEGWGLVYDVSQIRAHNILYAIVLASKYHKYIPGKISIMYFVTILIITAYFYIVIND